MKIGKVVKTAIKWAPVVYPIVRMLLDNKNTSSPTTTVPNRRK